MLNFENLSEPNSIHIWYVCVDDSIASLLSLFSISQFAITQSSSYKIGSIFPMSTGTGPSGVKICVTWRLNGLGVVGPSDILSIKILLKDH